MRELLALVIVLVAVRAVDVTAFAGLISRDSGDPVSSLTRKLIAIAVFLPFVQALYASKVADDAHLPKWGRTTFVVAIFVLALPIPYEFALLSI